MHTINKILLLGSGALKIGEAGEFDYSGTQAIKALKEEGKEVILVNPNIATIQTSKGMAHKNYLFPVKAEFVEKIIAKEKPDGILLSFGGQTALNCGIDLYTQGVLQKYSITVLGTPVETVIETEDRQLFAARLAKIGLKTAKGAIVKNIAEALGWATTIKYPVMLRTGFALGGTGSGVIKTAKELKEKLTETLRVYPQVILEEDLTGWKEVEYEVVRDKDDNCVTICNMENMDPIGIHTGESIVVAPSQTLNNYEYYFLREISIRVIRELKIVGECNIQFALHPKTGDYRIIEVNARLSRSSALASKATGYPLAYVAAKLALGKTLPNLRNAVTGKTTAFFEPALDYIVVKIPRWDTDKFTHAAPSIGSEMKSVGEVMSIARTFEEAIQKGARMLNDGYLGVIDKQFNHTPKEILLKRLKTPDTMRLFTICSALQAGVSVEEIQQLTHIDAWFLYKLGNIVKTYTELDASEKLTEPLLTKAKQQGFSDLQIAKLVNQTEDKIRELRKEYHLQPVVKQIDTLAGEFPAQTNYLYMTYSGNKNDHQVKEQEKKVIVVGSGPYSIGTSVEFDWCAVNTIATIRKNGLKGVMVNCNPETVSTDFDHSDYLYFEELTLERIRDIYEIERSPFILSVGGQIPNNLSQKLPNYQIPVLGTTPENIGRAENRQLFSELLDKLGIAQPLWGRAYSAVEARQMAKKITYPLLLRPSFVLSGKAMRVIANDWELDDYMEHLDIEIKEHPILMTSFLNFAAECDFDGVAQQGKVCTWAISQHVEGAGVHSGDSAMCLPPFSFSQEIITQIKQTAAKIIAALEVSGPVNIQFLVENDQLYVIECNLRASRSFPFVSKVTNVNFITQATEIILGKKVVCSDMPKLQYVGVKVPQFSFKKIKGADPVAKVEMNSTGEVAALGRDVHEAYLTALLSTGMRYPIQKAVFLSIGGMRHKMKFLDSVKKLSGQGFKMYATAGTAFYLIEQGIACQQVGKMYEGAEVTANDLIQNRLIDFAVVIPESISDHVSEQRVSAGLTDGYKIRRLAVDFGISVLTHISTAKMFIASQIAYNPDTINIKALEEYIGG